MFITNTYQINDKPALPYGSQKPDAGNNEHQQPDKKKQPSWVLNRLVRVTLWVPEDVVRPRERHGRRYNDGESKDREHRVENGQGRFQEAHAVADRLHF